MGLVFGFPTSSFQGFQIGCKVRRSTTQNISSGPPTPVLFDAEIYDPNNWHSLVSNTERIVVPENGYYHCVGGVQWSANTTGQRTLYLQNIGGTGDIVYESRDAQSAGFTQHQISEIFYMLAGYYVQLQVAQNSGATLTVGTSGGAYYGAYLGLQRIA